MINSALRTIGFCLVFSLAVVGCRKSSPGAAPPAKVFIKLEHTRLNSWRATYQLPPDTYGAVFRRQKAQFRETQWKVLTPGVKIQKVQNNETVVSSDGLLKTFTIEFHTPFNETPGDYELAMTFSDNSNTIYTGHFNLAPLSCPSSLPCAPEQLLEKQSSVETTFTFIPYKHEKVRVEDKTGDTLIWAHHHDGAFVYFGNLPPTESSSYKGVLDPALPNWVMKTLPDIFPRLIDFYSQNMGFPLTVKPYLYFSVSGYLNSEIRGSVIHNQIRLAIAGDQWDYPTSESRQKFMQLVSHELAHLWNADLFSPADFSGVSWMHEGGADAVSFQALYRLGFINRPQYLDWHSDALNRCLLELGARSLVEAESQGDLSVPYHCGSVINLMAGSLVPGQGGRSGLFTFWHHLFESAFWNNALYTMDSYFSTLRKLSTSSDGAEAVYNMAFSVKSSDEVLATLQQAGIHASQLGTPPPWFVTELNSVERQCRGHSNTSLIVSSQDTYNFSCSAFSAPTGYIQILDVNGL